MPLRRAQKHNHASEHIIYTFGGYWENKNRKNKKKNQKEGEGIPDGMGQ